MEFTVAKVHLVRELSLCQGVVEKRTTIPILSNVLLEARGNAIALTATDLELGIRCSCPAEVQQEGSGTVPLRRLLDYVRLLPDVNLSFKFLENAWASITCGRSRTRMAGISRESFPELPEMPEAVVELPIALLAQMIGKTVFAISAEESRFTLSGALLHFRSESLSMVATDGHRLAYVEATAPGVGASAPQRTLLPRKAMMEILRLAQEADPTCLVHFASDDNHLFFRVGDRLLMCRRLTGTFPDYDRVMPKEYHSQISLQRKELQAAIERVAQFADERSRSIRVEIAPGEVKVFSSLSDTGESEETLPVAYDGTAVEIGFNAQYLLDFLRASTEEEVSLLFKDPHSAAEVRPAGEGDGSHYRYIVMPMRV
jgi:DNA polymerase-3 subunit beta